MVTAEMTVGANLNFHLMNVTDNRNVDSRTDPDRATVDEALTGNVEAFETLVLRYQRQIVNYATAMIRDVSDAEDVAQDTFIRAYRALNQFRGDSSFKTWLYRIATNVARTHRDRRGRQSRLDGPGFHNDTQALQARDIPSSEANVETTVIARDAIDRALGVLPDELRVAIVLRDVEGFNYKEIAEVTRSPIGTVESRIFRARRALRPLLRPLVNAARKKSIDDDVRTS